MPFILVCEECRKEEHLPTCSFYSLPADYEFSNKPKHPINAQSIREEAEKFLQEDYYDFPDVIGD